MPDVSLSAKLDAVAQDASLGGTNAAAAGNTGASSTNGFLRWLRDWFVARTGQKTAANSMSVVLSSDGPFSSNFGLTTDAAAGSDTGTASHISLTKRLLQRITSLTALLPVSIGQKTGAGSISTVPASDAVHIVAGQSAIGAVPANPPVGVSAIDLAGLTRALLADALGQLFTTEQDSEVFTPDSVTSATVLFTADMTNWRSVLMQVTSAGSNCTVTYECSNDQSQWHPVVGQLVNANSATTPSSSIAGSVSKGATQYIFPKRGKYFRARVSVYGSGTVSVSYSLSRAEVSPIIAAAIYGQVPEGFAFSGNPVTIGVECRTVSKTAVGNGQIIRPIGTVDGKMIIRQHSIPENEWSYAAASGGILNDVTAVTITAAAGAPYRNYLTSIQLEAEPVTNATEFVIRDGAGGAVLWCIKIPTTGLPLTNFKFENPLKSSSATLLEVVTLTASGTGAVYFNAQGYVAP